MLHRERYEDLYYAALRLYEPEELEISPSR